MQTSSPRPGAPRLPGGSPLPVRTRALLGLLCAVIAVAGLVSYQRARRDRPPTLMQRLHGDSDEATSALAEMQAGMPQAGREGALLRLSRDPNPGTRYAAVDALGAEKDPAAADAMEAAFVDSSAEVRERAMGALPGMDRERGLRLLLRGLRDEDTWIRREAVSQLLLSRDGRDIPALLAGLDDPDPAVAHLAMGALRHQAREPFYASVRASPAQRRAAAEQWRRWWRGPGRSRFPPVPAFASLGPLRPQRTDPAPDFSLSDLDGRPLRLADQRGRVTLLNFWGSWCPPCRQEIPDLARLDDAYRGKGLDILGVALSEKSAPSLQAWCRAHGVAYRQALATEPMQQAYGNIQEVPVSVLIDQRGRIRYRWEGERDFATFRAAVARLLAEPTR